jgi:hypothetical protein
MIALPLTSVQFASLAAMLGALVYAIGDVLMLAIKADVSAYPNLQPHLKLLSGSEKMVALSWPRTMWGGLLGVFASPLLVAALWPLYYGLAPAGAWSAWPVVLLFGAGFILAPFVHGSFIYLAEYIQALNRVGPEAQAVIVAMLQRFKQVLAISYGAVAVSILIGSVWFSAAVALGGTRFPGWMAFINPITAVLAWLLIRRLLPKLTEPLEGAGFNIGFLAFFALVTVTLW